LLQSFLTLLYPIDAVILLCIHTAKDVADSLAIRIQHIEVLQVQLLLLREEQVELGLELLPLLCKFLELLLS